MQRRSHRTLRILLSALWLTVWGLVWPPLSPTLTTDAPRPTSLAAQEVPVNEAEATWTYLANTNRITAMALDAEADQMWTASAGGVVLWDLVRHTASHYTTLDGLASNDVRAIAIAGDDVWFGTAAGLTRLDAGGNWTTIRRGAELVHEDVRVLEVAPDGALWIGTWGGLNVRTPDGVWQRYTQESTERRLPSNHVQSLHVGDGERWIGTWNGGLAHWRSTELGDAWRTYETDTLEADGHTLVSDNIPAIAVDPNSGDLWVASAGRWDSEIQTYLDGSLSRMTPAGQWNVWDPKGDLLSEFIHDLQVTDDGLLWIASEGGASWIDIAVGRAVSHLTADQGLADDRVAAIEIGPEGDLYFGTAAGISHRRTDGRWSQLARDAELPSNSVSALALDGLRRHAWFGTREGVARFEAAAGDVDRIFATSGRFSNWVNDMAIDDAGTAWLATGLYDPTFAASQFYRGGGVIGLQPDGTQIHYTQARPDEDGLADNLVLSLAIDAEGTKWFGTWKGLSRILADGNWLPSLRAPAATVRVDDATDHAGLEGMIGKPLASFGTEGLSGELAVHGFACFHTVEVPEEDVRGKIALVEQGHCWSSDNLETAERNGAIGVVVYAGAGHEPIRMEGNDRGITIPAVMVDRATGEALRARRAMSETVNVRLAAADPSEGLVSDDVRAIVPVADGAWLGTYGGGAAFVDQDNQVIAYTSASTGGGLSNDRVLSIAEAPDGTMWFGTDGGGISRRTPAGLWLDPITQASTDWALLGDRISALAFDEDDTTWIGVSGREDPDPDTELWLRGGLNQIDAAGAWSHLRSEDGLPDDNVLAIATGTDGQVLVGTHGGAYMRVREFNGRCDRALALPSETNLSAHLRHVEDVHYYRFEVAEPHSHILVSVSDDENALQVRLFRSCSTIDSDSGRKIASGVWDPEFSEQRIEHDTGSDTGTFYIEVRQKVRAVAGDRQYSLNLDVTAVDANSVRSLILTNLSQLQSYAGPLDPPDRLASALSSLAADPRVRGRLVTDLQDAVGGDYQLWVQGPGDPALANAAALALRNWIAAQRAALPELHYIVLVGDDRVIPHFRQHVPAPGDTEWAKEADYLKGGTAGAIRPNSALHQALAVNLTLSDDFYAAEVADHWGNEQEIFIPQLAIGRLVERPDDIARLIETFLASEGPKPIRQSLAAGWDFMQDGPTEGARLLEEAGHLGRVRRLLGDAWSADNLREELGGQPIDLAFLGVHANHFAYEGPSGALRAQTLADAPPDMAGAIAYSLSCHGGLNVPGTDMRPEGEPVDLPEAWQSAGAHYISSTGWAYGMQGALGYQEALMVDFTAALVEGQSTAIGDALMRTKQEYFTAHEMNAYHVKTLVGTVLYGLPMASYRLERGEHSVYLPIASVPRVGTSAAAIPLGRDGGAAPRSIGAEAATHRAVEHPVAARNARPEYLLPASTDIQMLQFPKGDVLRQTLVSEQLRALLERHDSQEGSHYAFRGQRPMAENGRAVQPMLRQNLGVSAGREHWPARGVMLKAAAYATETLDTPVVARAGILDPTARRTVQNEPHAAPEAWLPERLLSLRRMEHQDAGDPTLLLYLGQYHGGTRIQRLYDQIEVQVFYSDHEDRRPPTIEEVTVIDGPAGRELQARVADVSGIPAVSATCDDGRGYWTSEPLVEEPETGVWRGTVAADAACLVQAADGAGNVAVDDKDGALHGSE